MRSTRNEMTSGNRVRSGECVLTSNCTSSIDRDRCESKYEYGARMTPQPIPQIKSKYGLRMTPQPIQKIKPRLGPFLILPGRNISQHNARQRSHAAAVVQ